MITTKSPGLNRLFRTPLHTAVLATLVSLILASLINFIFLSPNTLPMTLMITFIIAAPMSYLTVKVVITMRVTIEDQKVKLALERERADILSKFIRDAAHEFKTPLTLMSTNLYLAEKTTDQEKKQAYTQSTHEQIQTLISLLESIMILTRLDSIDKTAYPREPVKAAELLSAFRSFDGSQRIKLPLENMHTLPVVQANQSDIHLALKHILNNALRFSPDASQVTIQLESSGQWLVLQIGDHGHGMNAETMQHIFDRFYRIDESHTSRGLGLGLAIAKRVFELHDGYIEVQSEIGKGTTFKTYLPISRHP